MSANTALDIAKSYIQRGWNPTPIPFKSKIPPGEEWQKRIIDNSNVSDFFNDQPQNIGVIMGPTSGGLVDVDLDCPEAIAIAAFILPKTGAIFGRPSARMAHWLYRTDLALTADKSAIRFKDPSRPIAGVTLVELRIGGAKGAQTVFPGSIHESGEAISWEDADEPAAVDGAELIKKVKLIAVGALFIRYWPGLGARHDAALAVGGFMARAGHKPEWIKYFVECVARAAGCNNVADKKNAAFESATNTLAGKKTYGLKTVRELFGEAVGSKIAEWLEYQGDGCDQGGGNEHGDVSEQGDVARLNKTHAVLPIGDKTRVVTFGELEEFPGLETITMVQTLGDFQALHNRYRHVYTDPKGDVKRVPMGTHWVESPNRRQYDGGMEFMPQKEGDFGNKLNLWRGFGVTPTKPEPGSRAEAGCQKFLAFMRDIICSGNEVDFGYLLRREATMFQKRKRTEVAIGLKTGEEGCGKGFYEKVMKRLLGSHCMQVTNPRHIIGNFNPHLQTLLRLTADEALFVGNHEHRNALFGMVTESKLTIEPKGCGVFQVNNFLNISMLSNSEHFLPVSDSARRFFVPIASAARKQDTQYFGDLESDLETGGYEALLYHFLHEVDLSTFNVRQVPQSDGLLEQRDQSLDPLNAWWTELLESGVLTGADPANPRCAVSHEYERKVEWQVISGGATNTHVRHVKQRGFLDQARGIEPKLRNVSDHRIGAFLTKMGCKRTRVLRQRGWEFPPLSKCRTEWGARYPHWKWGNSDITAWSAEDGENATALDADPARHADWAEGKPLPKDLRG
jgi:hypothetical protein